jgi:hypothetical protein
MNRIFQITLAITLLLGIFNLQLVTLHAQGTGFTYQGQLTANGNPANGSYDVKFTLFATNVNGTAIGGPVTNSAVGVTNGLFTTLVKFSAGVFNGSSNWLEIGVSTNGLNSFTTLNPRQQVTPTPYALFSVNASNVLGTVPAGQLSGTIPVAILPTVVITNGASNVNFSGTFTGNGSGLTNLNASKISSGVIAQSVLPGFQPIYYSTIGGGNGNSVSSDYYETVGGGVENAAGAQTATISGGGYNTANSFGAAVGGGNDNGASSVNATVSGGYYNTASGYESAIGGGYYNTASGYYATVGGGQTNTASGQNATVGGGYNNIVNNLNATVGGGFGNIVGGDGATVGGGYGNTANGLYATVSGGNANGASGQYAIAAGGHANSAAGDFSFAGGNHASAPYQGDFVWADDNGGALSAAGNNQFYVRATGGVAFYSNSGATTGVTLAAGSGSWSSVSDRNLKENFKSVDAQTILNAVAAMPMSTWNYKAQAKSIRHVGPMAQDFYTAFDVGENDTTISTVDEGGVALAAIQGLNEKLEEKDAKIKELESRLEKLEQLMNAKSGETK